MSLIAILEVVSPGALAAVQDQGRTGWRRLGVPKSGALDPALLRIANVLAGNAQGDAVIEFFVAGPTLKAETGPVQLGFAGDFPLTLMRCNGEPVQLESWRSVTLLPGDSVRAGSPRGQRGGYIAVAGLQVQRVLGSASTYTRAQLGGHGGRALVAGDKLVVQGAAAMSDTTPIQRLLRKPPSPGNTPIRVVPGPQADCFDSATMQAFFEASYQVTADADRMGVRLQGPALAHRADKGSDIVSDATVPGSIQVPGNGQPIVLLADGQTAGGYPKIATVISADLPRLALAAVGARLRFEAVTVAQAEAIARSEEAALRTLLASIKPLLLDGDIDLTALYDNNLVSGVVDAQENAQEPTGSTA